MEISYIEEFLTLVEVGNYQAAAEQMFISQSSLSRHIQSLENDLGISLFTRTSRRIALSEFGRIFLPYAREMQDLKNRYTTALAQQKKKESVLLTIGAIPTMAKYGITEFLARFKKENPEFSLHIIENDSQELLRMMETGLCDIAFLRSGTAANIRLEQHLFYEDHLVAILPVSHPLAGQKSVALEELKNEDFLFLPKTTSMYDFCRNACLDRGFTPHIAFTGHHADNIINLVASGFGVGLLSSEPLLTNQNPQVTIVDISPKYCSNIMLCTKPEQQLRMPEKKFLQFYRDTLQ